MVDFDNDGWKDLFVARSNVLDNIRRLVPERRYPEPNSAFRNLGNGKFEDVSPEGWTGLPAAGATSRSGVRGHRQ